MEWLGWLPLVLPGGSFVGLTAHLQTDYKVLTGHDEENGLWDASTGRRRIP